MAPAGRARGKDRTKPNAGAAIRRYTDVLEKRKRVLGNDDPTTLDTTNNLAIVLTNLGKHNVVSQFEGRS